MYCPECGKQIDNNAKFCRHCGSPVSPDPAVGEITNKSTGGLSTEVTEILLRHNGKRIDAAKEVMLSYGLKLTDAKKLVDEAYSNIGGGKSAALLQRMTAAPSKRQVTKQRIASNKQEGVACCPKCGSTSLSANKKGFGIGKAVVGAALTGGIGLVAGNIGAKKVWVTCLNCGHRWKI